MNNQYLLLFELRKILNETESLLNKMLSLSKEQFVNNTTFVNVGAGLVSEIGKTLNCLEPDFYALNKSLSDLIIPIKKYYSNLYDKYILVNAYKLYDFLKIDLKNLQTYLNKNIG